MTFHAYIHTAPGGTAQDVFYVGKGSGKRYLSFNNRSKEHRHVVAEIGAENVLIGKLDCSSEAIAFDLERGLIKCLTRSGVKLCNKTTGGQGASGTVKSEATRAKLSAALKGKCHPQTPETRAKIANTLKGLKRSEDFSAAISARTKGRVVSAETRAKISAANTGKVRPKTAIEAARAKNMGSKRSPETKANMAEARRAYWARRREENK